MMKLFFTILFWFLIASFGLFFLGILVAMIKNLDFKLDFSPVPIIVAIFVYSLIMT